MENPWRTLEKSTVYENPWIEVSHRQVLNPAGKEGIYGVVHFKNLAIGIVPIDEAGYTWLVGQYRYSIDQYSWEIPAGGGPLGSPALLTAKRELLEETGIKAGSWDPILDFHLSNSVTDETGIIYLARELSFYPPEPEETEQLMLKKIPFQEAIEMVLSGVITDSLSIMALLRAQLYLETEKQASLKNNN